MRIVLIIDQHAAVALALEVLFQLAGLAAVYALAWRAGRRRWRRRWPEVAPGADVAGAARTGAPF